MSLARHFVAAAVCLTALPMSACDNAPDRATVIARQVCSAYDGKWGESSYRDLGAIRISVPPGAKFGRLELHGHGGVALHTARGVITFENGYWGEDEAEGRYEGDPKNGISPHATCNLVVNGIAMHITVANFGDHISAGAIVGDSERPREPMKMRPLVGMTIASKADLAEFERMVWSIRPSNGDRILSPCRPVPPGIKVSGCKNY